MTTLSDAVAAVYRASFADFVRGAWHIHHANEPLRWAWYLRALCDEMQALVEGRGKAKLRCHVPPGTCKSLLASVYLPAFVWLSAPHKKILACSSDSDVVKRDALRMREVINSEWYQDTFVPAWYFDTAQDAKGYYKNTAHGARVSRTVGQAVTGHRFDIGIIDDPLDARDAISGNAKLKSHSQWYKRVFYSRRNRGAVELLIMQRLHQLDLAGILEAEQKDLWRSVVLPLEFEDRPDKYEYDKRSEPGELLAPWMEIEILKRTLGAEYFGQAQQRPGNPEGSMIRVEHLRQVWDNELRRAVEYYVVSVDTSLRDAVQNDYTVIQVWGVVGARRLLLHQARGRWHLPRIERELDDVLLAYPSPRAIIIERSNNGAAIIRSFGERFSGVVGVDHFTGRDSKVARVQLCLPSFEAGDVYLPPLLAIDSASGHSYGWVEDYTYELLGFPKGANDDCVDTTTQALRYIHEHGGIPWAC
jgi:predicted phage terminase large subunit-like protein